jgi:histone acetyltransferase 1
MMEGMLVMFALDGNRTWEIYMCEVTTPGFLKYHDRLQTFVLWFIDAASFIDTDDDHWRFFLM